jgi:uroporphyrinogen III methyltransferase/synthase
VKPGKVWLAGAGPGDPELLTLGTQKALEAADTVVYDRLVSEEIIMALPPGLRLIDAGKAPGNHTLSQEAINGLLIKEARKGRAVVRLKGGDPFLFGRGGEEALALAGAGIPFEVIPGVSSALGVPALAGIPVSHRGISGAVHIISWHGKDGPPPGETLEALARAGGTLVILMAAAGLETIGPSLIRAGFAPATPAALIEQGTTPRQRVRNLNLAGLASAAEAEPPDLPALVRIGEVCSLGEKLFTPPEAPRKLRIVVTRPEPQNRIWRQRFRELGAGAIAFPCIKRVPLGRDKDRRYLKVREFSWLVFTSAEGVEIFFNRYRASGGDFRDLAPCRFAVIGPATAEALTKRGFIPDYIPPEHNGPALGAGLGEKMAPGEKALLLRADRKDPGLCRGLRQKNAAFREWPLYRTVPAAGGAEARKRIETGACDGVFFASPSAVSSFAGHFPSLDFSPFFALCFGGSTAAAAEKLGMKVLPLKDAAPETAYLGAIASVKGRREED